MPTPQGIVIGASYGGAGVPARRLGQEPIFNSDNSDMKTQAMDTSPELEKIQFDLMRQAGPQRRFELAREFTGSMIALARSRIAAQHPDWTTQQVALQWAEIMYGEETAKRLRRELERRGQLS
jgi:hypothetical protein